MDSAQIVSLVLGAIGTSLGVLNFVIEMWKAKIRLRITPVAYYSGPNGYLTFSNSLFTEKVGLVPSIGVEVVNFSRFPVTIYEVGVAPNGRVSGGRQPISRYIIDGGEKLPFRLPERESLTIYSKHSINEFSITEKSLAYVKTACDKTVYGDSEAFKVIKRSFSG
ncbi:hypothetical protein [Parvibaculum sp.]|uniref:hypothetical protein n=1 Tax=Parvibaculum sp. TaxID=2024848 RepID=UPI0025E56289|nr:hypothetical protein [Parvibaculum sp.]